MTVAVANLLGQYNVTWDKMMAITTLFSLPIFIVFIFTQRTFIKGLMSGSVKG